MFRVLSKMGFGQSFISWIKLFYTLPLSTVLVNGFFSEPFSLSRGVRQGCPLSAALYVLVAESLACRIRASLSLSGLSLPLPSSESILISQYADDTSLFCTSDDEILAVFDIYRDYESASGAKLNLEKCKGLWCGSWRGRTTFPISLAWSSQHLKCLGVFIGHGDLEELNWTDRLIKLTTLLHSWNQRSLSLTGKSVVLNALALSGLWYSASVIHIPDWALTAINRAIFSFFWSNKKELVSRQTLALPPNEGGFALCDPQLKSFALKSSWIRRLVLHPSSKWCSLFDFFSRHYLGVSIYSLLSDPAFFPIDLLPPFYYQVVNAWALIDGTISTVQGFSFKSSSGSLVPITSSTCKSIYFTLVSSLNQPPRCIGKFRPIYGDLYWDATWKQISFFPVDRKTKDLSWKIAHGVPLTADRLISFGMRVDPLCFCQADESLVHLFFHCPFMSTLLIWAHTLFLRVTPLCPTLHPRHLLFGFNPQELEIVPPVFVYFLNLVKYFVWLSRNDFRFNRTQPDLAAVRAKICSRFNVHLKIFSSRFKSPRSRRYFHRAWNVLGKFSPDLHSISFE